MNARLVPRLVVCIKPFIVPFVFLMLVAVSVNAQVAPPLCSAWSNNSGTHVSLMVLPNGAYPSFTNAQAMPGVAFPTMVHVRMLDFAGMPVAGIPPCHLRLVTSMGGVQAVSCIHADAPTGPAGQTTFSIPPHAGGYSNIPAEIAHVQWWSGGGWVPIPEPSGPLDVYFNSPDINGDLIVNLVDIVMFAGYFTGVYGYAADFCFDGVINLCDIVMMAQGLGASGTSPLCVTCP